MCLLVITYFYLPHKFYVVLFISLAQLFNMLTGVNGKIIINSKYYKFDLYFNFFLLLITLLTNFIFIPTSSPLTGIGISGINGAAFATSLSVLLFNIVKLIFIYIKLGIHPFSVHTFQAIVLILFVYSVISFIPFPLNLSIFPL